METAGFSHGESTRLVIEAPWLVNGGHGASLRHHKWLAPGEGVRARDGELHRLAGPAGEGARLHRGPAEQPAAASMYFVITERE
jgi:hypothetical protein